MSEVTNVINDNIEEKYNEVERYFNSLGLKWTASSIRYLISKGYEGLTKTFNTLRPIDPVTTLGLIECSVQDKDKANDIMNDWMDKGYGLTVLHMLIIGELQDNGCFKDEDEVEMIMHLSSKKNGMTEMSYQAAIEEMTQKIMDLSQLSQI